VARSRGRERGWPPVPDALPFPVVDNHTHLESVLGWVAEGWHGRADDGRADDGRADDGAGARDDHASPVMPPTLDDHLVRAASVGVTRMVQVGCDLDAVTWTDEVVRARPELVGAVAIHPNEAVLHAGVHEVAPDGLDPDPQPRHATSLDDAIVEQEIARAEQA